MEKRDFIGILHPDTSLEYIAIPWRWRLVIWWRTKILRQPLVKGEPGEWSGFKWAG